ncbi:3-hydroxyisobutyrate dehydrogenase-like beta-hydroxyacid dehydrogenase [Chitinophagaceae bacterium OAS944]|nr:3-hydroxyisobutyrate dehydrogenase-like beta-hydroxyacid dehydrogenase [Chitinophagaceae bacterium OAS944]
MTSKSVTVIGLGAMGSALANAMLAKQFKVTVWNRNKSKAASLAAKGAFVAESITDAIKASQLLLVCVSDYKATIKIFAEAGVKELLAGRTIVQLSTGTPKEARELDAWAKQNGANCLNGDILAWPRQIGTNEATITISGDNEIFSQHVTELQGLAGNINFVGEEPGTSAVLFSAVMAYLAGNWIGFCHGALICENEGFRPDAFGELIHNISPILATESKHMGQVIQNNKFTDPESTINTTGLDLHLLVQQAEEAGISKELPQFAANIFQRAIDAGFGQEEHAAIIKVMRSAS